MEHCDRCQKPLSSSDEDIHTVEITFPEISDPLYSEQQTIYHQCSLKYHEGLLAYTNEE